MNRVFSLLFAEKNIQLELYERSKSPTDEANPDLQYDWKGFLSLPQSKEKYPQKLRMVQIWYEEQQIYLELLTNNFTWTASARYSCS